jgi:Inner membrane protein YgaP-like, transmembrane domain
MANVGGADKAIRILVGIALVMAGFFHFVPGNWAIAAYVLGGIALVTGLFGFCPAWAIFKVNTASVRQGPSK